MLNIDIAKKLIVEAITFNTFGAANVRGIAFQQHLSEKFATWGSGRIRAKTGGYEL